MISILGAPFTPPTPNFSPESQAAQHRHTKQAWARIDTQGISDQQEFWVCACFPALRVTPADVTKTNRGRGESGGQAPLRLPTSAELNMGQKGSCRGGNRCCLFRREVLFHGTESLPNHTGQPPQGVKNSRTGSGR